MKKVTKGLQQNILFLSCCYHYNKNISSDMIGLAQNEHTSRTYRKTKIHCGRERTLILTNKNNLFFFTICYFVLYIIQFSGKVCIRFILDSLLNTKQYVTQVYNIYFRSFTCNSYYMIVITKKVFFTMRSIHEIYNIGKDIENVPKGKILQYQQCIYHLLCHV